MMDCGFASGSGAIWRRQSRPALVSSRCAVRPRFASRTRVTAVKDVTEADFDDNVLKSDLPVLVDFYASWCGPCKLIAPLMDWAANEYNGKLEVFKIDTEVNPTFVRKYDIHGLPTLCIFRDGEHVSQVEGAVGKQKVIKFLEDNDIVKESG